MKNSYFIKNRIIKALTVAFSAFSLCLILCPVQFNISSWAVFSFIIAVFFAIFYLRFDYSIKQDPEIILLTVISLCFPAYFFYNSGLSRLSFITVSSILHQNIRIFVLCLSVFLAVLSVPAMLVLYNALVHIKKKASNYFEKHFVAFPVLDSLLRMFFSLLLISSIQFISLQYCAAGISATFSIRSWLTSVLLLILIYSVFSLLFGKWKTSLFVASFILFLWSIANYYTILFHGSPLYISEFANIWTAAAVAMNYKYSLSREIVFAVLILVAELIIIRRNPYISAADINKKGYLIKISILIISFVLIIPSYKSTIKEYKDWMPWNQSVYNCGFLTMNIEDVSGKKKAVNEPFGYSLSSIDEFISEDINPVQTAVELPDIILILNESLYDLEYYTDLEADISPLKDLYSLDNTVSGYAITPKIGGGTNNSEFELLMSKSNYLLKNGAPFTFLSDYQMKRSAVQYLKNLGYSTTAMHSENGRNYNRDVAYPTMAFDNVILGREKFHFYEMNDNRPGTDLGNYKDLLRLYEANVNGPCFYYLLTFQNHGGYEQNGTESDTVHIRNDFGDLTDDVEEYLSSLKLSAEAFKFLIESFRSEDRKVIICMVGDHAPSFINALPSYDNRTEIENEIVKRSVPYFIWSNFNLQIRAFTDLTSLTDLVPMILEAADLPLTTYYSYVLEMHEIIPVRVSNGLYLDKDGNIGTYSSDSPYYDMLSKFYYLEYNSLMNDSDYCRELFELHLDQLPKS